MAEINFDCPFCGQNLDAPADMAGWAIDCPSCDKKIKIPSPTGTQPPLEPVDTTNSKDKATTGLIENRGSEDEKKESTVRIDIPEEYRLPQPSQRIVKIKRMGK